jgi:hypothetical protein
MPAALSPLRIPASARIRLEVGSGGRFEAGLLLPAGIKDGTSNTVMFTLPGGPVQTVATDASRIWINSRVLEAGFGLLLPAVAAAAVHPGAVFTGCRLLPYIEQDNLYRKGITLERAQVASIQRIGADIAVWLVPAGIIAVLIGL